MARGLPREFVRVLQKHRTDGRHISCKALAHVTMEADTPKVRSAGVPVGSGSPERLRQRREPGDSWGSSGRKGLSLGGSSSPGLH